MQNKTIKSLILILGFSLLSACSSTQDKINDETIGWSAPQLYSAARDNVRSNSWNTASAYLHTIGTRFPYSSYAQQAMIDEAYVLWRDDEPEKAKAVIDRFNRLYPNHPHGDYMLYLKGLITFTPPSAFLSSYTGQDQVSVTLRVFVSHTRHLNNWLSATHKVAMLRTLDYVLTG